jgi:hypothetical protein
MVLNGYNEVPIHKKSWRAVIQPKSRVSMAIMLENASFKMENAQALHVLVK